jgi:hypothetical protein
VVGSRPAVCTGALDKLLETLVAGRLAISKDGKPLAGAAKTAIVNKCKKDSCEPKAVSSDGKFMKKCQNDA